MLVVSVLKMYACKILEYLDCNEVEESDACLEMYALLNLRISRLE